MCEILGYNNFCSACEGSKVENGELLCRYKNGKFYGLPVKHVLLAPCMKIKKATMEQDYIKIAKHCIGLDRKKPYIRHGKKFYRPYRNYFYTGSYHDDWDNLVLAGYAEQGDRNQHGGYTYWLTREGLDWLGNELGIKIYDESD